ncbi:unnamed protein product [Diplocarpon coronariae]
MLRHVYNCPHLSKGLYWCFHCQKPERVGKFQCKRCQGNTSGKGLFASVAKKIFSKLGAKPHRFDHAATTGASENLTNRYLDFDVEESSVMASFQDRFQQDRRMKWCLPDAQELPSTSVIPEMAGDWKAASHELADTCISEMLGAGCPVELGAGLENWEDNFYAESFEEFDVASEPVKTRVSSPKLARLDTSVAQTALCSNWPDTPRSTTIISPMSAIMRSDSTRSAIEISPTDSEASGNSFFTDSAYSRATTHSATFSNGSIKRFPSIGNIGDKKGTKDGDFCLVSEESINSTPGSVPPPLPEEGAPLKRNILQKAQVNSTAEHSAGRFTGSSEPKLPSPNWDDATSLVRSFSEALDSHIQHSKATLQALSPTPTVRELLSVPRSSMISTGLEVLANLLAGRHPTSTIQVFSFTHVACALAIAVDDGDVRAHTEKWLRNTLIYASGLQGERHKKGYEQVAKAIWEPSGSSVSNDLLSDSSRSIESLQPTTCKHFLDIFETLHSSTPGDLPVSHHFDSAQASSEHKVKACIIERLTNSPKIEDFTEYASIHVFTASTTMRMPRELKRWNYGPRHKYGVLETTARSQRHNSKPLYPAAHEPPRVIQRGPGLAPGLSGQLPTRCQDHVTFLSVAVSSRFLALELAGAGYLFIDKFSDVLATVGDGNSNEAFRFHDVAMPSLTTGVHNMAVARYMEIKGPMCSVNLANSCRREASVSWLRSSSLKILMTSSDPPLEQSWVKVTSLSVTSIILRGASFTPAVRSKHRAIPLKPPGEFSGHVLASAESRGRQGKAIMAPQTVSLIPDNLKRLEAAPSSLHAYLTTGQNFEKITVGISTGQANRKKDIRAWDSRWKAAAKG